MYCANCFKHKRHSNLFPLKPYFRFSDIGSDGAIGRGGGGGATKISLRRNKGFKWSWPQDVFFSLSLHLAIFIIYLYCLLIDFSNTFYFIHHRILVNKLKLLILQYDIMQWVVSFLTDREQFTKVCVQKSNMRIISRSIVQSYCIGFTLYYFLSMTCVI